jgi:hypothetical protein
VENFSILHGFVKESSKWVCNPTAAEAPAVAAVSSCDMEMRYGNAMWKCESKKSVSRPLFSVARHYLRMSVWHCIMVLSQWMDVGRTI